MRPNIVLIITDQQAASAMSCAGSDWLKTPNMDRIAKQGVQFTRAYCANPHCVPSRASIFTGQYSSVSKMNPIQFPSLGKTLADSGYKTAYFGKWHVGKSKADKNADWHGFEICKTGVIDSETAADAVQYLQSQSEAPFFMVASFLNPHDCCEYAREKGGFKDRIRMRNGAIDLDPPINDCPPLPDNFAIPEGEPEALAQIRNQDSWRFFHPGKDWSDEEWRQYKWGYARLVEKVDAEVGKVLDALESADLDKDTLVIFTADHGDGMGSHKWNQKLVFYDESVRVPLLMAWKGKTQGGTEDDRLVNTGLDLMPTLCDYAGAKRPDKIEGLSFRHDASNKKHEYIISEVDLPIKGCMLRDDTYKYLYYVDGKNPEVLFDCKNDPGETRNLISRPEMQERIGIYREIMQKHIRET
ncbi:MAG: sulfatase [Candidatus Sumerlaeota bacterium]